MSQNASHQHHLGLVMRSSECFNWVWIPMYPTKELQFIGQENFMPGHLVKCFVTEPVDQLQETPLEPNDNFTIEPLITLPEGEEIDRFCIMVHVGFPPADSNYFDEDLARANSADFEFECTFYGHSAEVGKVASFLTTMEFEPGEIYMAWVQRIPTDKDALIPYIGTLFAFIEEDFVKIEDPSVRAGILAKMPWNAQHHVAERNDHPHSTITQGLPSSINTNVQQVPSHQQYGGSSREVQVGTSVAPIQPRICPRNNIWHDDSRPTEPSITAANAAVYPGHHRSVGMTGDLNSLTLIGHSSVADPTQQLSSQIGQGQPIRPIRDIWTDDSQSTEQPTIDANGTVYPNYQLPMGISEGSGGQQNSMLQLDHSSIAKLSQFQVLMGPNQGLQDSHLTTDQPSSSRTLNSSSAERVQQDLLDFLGAGYTKPKQS